MRLLKRKSSKKIPCYVLVYDQVAIIKKTLAFLVTYADRLDIVIIENPSDNTPAISKLINSYGEKGLISRYYLFDSNITSTAFGTAINAELQTVKKAPFVLVTDGDLVVESEKWLDEEIAILKRNPEVFACGVSLDKSNLPLAAFPEAKDWVPPDIKSHPTFFEALTGCHLLLFRGRQFSDFMKWKNENNHNFVDGTMHHYCYEILGKKWSRTKHAEAYHLTWDLYQDKKNAYTKLKTKQSFKETWYHNRQSEYTLKIY
ncbi:MAG TPA: hypothetical protein VIJ68_04055 [Candidatus Saccharimonadales bacterium]